MRILFIVPELSCGGAERVVSILASALSGSNYDVYLMVHNNRKTSPYTLDEKIKLENVKFHYPKNHLYRLFEIIRRVFKLRNGIFKISPDYVVASLTGCAMITLLSLLFSNKKVVVCEHNQYYSIKNPLKRLLRNIIYFRADRITILTKRDISNYPFFLKNKLIVQENPLSWAPEMFIRPKWHGKLLAVGRLENQKNIAELIEIVSLLKEKNLNVTLDIVGHGSLLANLQRKVESFGLSESVNFLGERSDMSDIYKNHDLLVMTSHYEGLPMVIAEAFSRSLPVIAYDCPTGPREMIDEGINGYLIQQYNKNDFCQSIIMLSVNDEAYQAMQLQAFLKSSQWDTHNIVEKFKGILL